MKQFTVLTALFSISALAVWAFIQAAPAPRSSDPMAVYDAIGEMLKAIHAGDSVAIAPVYDSTGAMLAAINSNTKDKPVVEYGNALELKYAQPWLEEAQRLG